MQYKTNGSLNYNGTLYKPDSKVKIDDQKIADQLLSAGVISVYPAKVTAVIEEEPEKKATKKKSIVSIAEATEVTEENPPEQQTPLGV